ncbi:hypothetical protein [Microbacterium allomyrinae]|jgi:hypothetical protein|uniref:Uncharacterized protein n=1 Tax=Microbacterium allomyrinae TaxID=2830666 RepID=A0A9X1S2W5_9MICO|nr:hypothetical protein [Microbacterium allomyrinae]MCC2031363.1 hypothetical protein [Microbacterium allomyrinae]
MSTAGNESTRSTTGNEYEQPGINYPDREDADGATRTPAEGEPTREGAAPPEPSHTAVGIGVPDEGTDHHGQDDGRDTSTAGEAQRTPGALGTEQEQRLPAMAQNNASDVEKVTGIVAQTRSDVGTESLERIADVLRQRLEQSGVDLPDDDIQELARQVSVGDAADPV